MVRVLPPLRPSLPETDPGLVFRIVPSPHYLVFGDYEYYDPFGRDPLQQHRIWGIPDPLERVEKLKELLADFPKQRHRRQILRKAASRGDEAIVRCLVETGLKIHPDIPEDSQEGQYEDGCDDENGIIDKDDPAVVPLHVAASSGKLGCVKIMLEEGHLEVDIRDDLGRTPLTAAEDVEVVKYLLDQDADPTARSNSEGLAAQLLGAFAGANALEHLAMKGNIEAVRLLLEHPFFRSTRKKEGQEDEEQGFFVTPLAIKAAGAGGGFEMLKLLLERGAYPMEDKDGETKGELLSEEQKQAVIDATWLTIYRGDLASIKLLLSYQYPTDKDSNLLPFEVPESLHKAFTLGAYDAMANNSPEKFEFLSSFGIKQHDAMSLDKLPKGQLLNTQHLLDTAAENGSLDCAKLLIEQHGADPTLHRHPSCTPPLYKAAARNKPEMLRYLLSNFPTDIHAAAGRYATGPTPLWIAIHLKSLPCVALLLQHGGPLEHIDAEILNVTSPMTAILKYEYGHRAPVRFLAEDNAAAFVRKAQQDWHHVNAAYVRVEIGVEDRGWIRKLRIRKGDEELRERGVGARDLSEGEARRLGVGDEEGERALMRAYPTYRDREEELDCDEELLPRWMPGLGESGENSTCIVAHRGESWADGCDGHGRPLLRSPQAEPPSVLRYSSKL